MMRVLVGVKRVVDYLARVRVNPDKVSGVELTNVKMSMNPFCEIAVEEAVKLKEAKLAQEVVAVSIGPKACSETLRTALAMGADRGIHLLTDLRTDFMQLQPLTVAKLLHKVAMEKEEHQFDLVLVGKQSIDSDCGHVGPMLAGLMQCPQVTFAANLDVVDDGEERGLVVERETDQGTETLRIRSLPAVVSCDLRLNKPRYVNIKGIMMAKKKPIETLKVEDMGVGLETLHEILEVHEPPPRKEGVIVSDVSELVDKLRNEANVIP